MINPEKQAREEWLVAWLLDRIQFYIWADAQAGDVRDAFNGLNEGSAFDDHVAALVQVPRYVSNGEAQQIIDRAFPAEPLQEMQEPEPKKPLYGEPGFEFPPCGECGSTSFRCGCD